VARLVLALLLVMAGTVLAPSAAAADTFTVNTTSDTSDGTCNGAHCSLREALTAAQAGGPHTIAFNIPGAGVKTIVVGSCLPTVVRQITIDGYTQPGSSPNTNPTGAISAVPLIELRGTPACGYGLAVQASTTVKGLVLNGFSFAALSVGGTTLTVQGSFIGTTADGLSAHVPDFNSAGNGIVTDNASLVIGGTTPAARNVLSGNGIAIQHVGNGTGVLQGNLIGTNKLGTARVANGDGYRALGGCLGGTITSTIGGDSPAARNVISGNARQAILLAGYAGVGCGEMRATNSVVQGNHIGTDVTGTAPLGNAWAGEPRAAVEVQNGPNVSIGGPAPGQGNIIAFNGFQGVVMHHGLGFNRTGLRVLGNRIHSNGALGIDLWGASGVTANDPGDVDTNLQNFPAITGVIRNGASTTIQGTLSSVASRTYRVEFFVNDAADASSHGEGQVFLLATNVTTNGSGSASFSMPVPVAIGPTQFVTATATANDGEGNTSEFSELTTDLALSHTDTPDPTSVNQLVTHTLTVTNTGTAFPSGPVTLTFTAAAGAAIVNNGGGTTAGSTITFNLGTLPVGATAVRTVVLRHATIGAKTSTATVSSVVNDPAPANNTAAATTTVTVPPTLFTISGQVRDLNDTGVPGVTMTLSGSQAATLTTDLGGRYVFTGLPAGGTYTVTPSKATFAFNPPSQTFPNLSRDEVAQFFVAQVGTFTRYFAEGATGDFFDTQIALLNATGQPAVATVTFQRPAPQPEVSTVVNLTGLQRVTIDPKALGLATAEFSTVITSTQPIVADRTMTWDPSGYGSHAETSVGRPLTQWFLAEGATINGFDLFYLIQNPGDVTAEVQVRYLLPAPAAPIVKTYSVAPRSRFNIWVNTEDPALDEAELSASITVTNDVPVIVERAMYRPVGTQLFGAGHESMGVEAPALEWFFGEGATGTFFDLFFLIANPSPQVSQLEARYLTPDGTVVTRTYAVPPNSRFNIWVDFEGPELANTAVSTTLRVLNNVPVVAERAMWWPGSSTSWHEGHNTAGATAVGEKWALAEGEVGGPRSLETYILIGNTSAFAGTARVTLTFEDGTQATRDFPLEPNSRTSIPTSLDFPAAVGKRFGTVVESLGPTPAQIVVERAMYSNAGGVTWAAGTSALATRLR
jgi:CSLREA domain-containing protein